MRNLIIMALFVTSFGVPCYSNNLEADKNNSGVPFREITNNGRIRGQSGAVFGKYSKEGNVLLVAETKPSSTHSSEATQPPSPSHGSDEEFHINKRKAAAMTGSFIGGTVGLVGGAVAGGVIGYVGGVVWGIPGMFVGCLAGVAVGAVTGNRIGSALGSAIAQIPFKN